jgi:hypothetical protein
LQTSNSDVRALPFLHTVYSTTTERQLCAGILRLRSRPTIRLPVAPSQSPGFLPDPGVYTQDRHRKFKHQQSTDRTHQRSLDFSFIVRHWRLFVLP